jgi:hypothetical protein
MSDRLVVGADARLAEQLARLADRRMVFVAGLPGTGKSLLLHQLVHIAARAGRHVHLLQWDVARPGFEASHAGRRYPQVNGVTHAVIRRATGLWARAALAIWDERHPAPEHLLVGETPFVGNRFVELARRLDDRVEALLTAPSCRFVIVVPSPEVRRFIEAERELRSASPRHPREREDASPRVLRDLWRDLVFIEAPGRVAGDAPVPYDPILYTRVYERVLRHRPREVVAQDVIMPTRTMSVYDFSVQTRDLVPTAPEADAFVREVERGYPDLTVLEAEMARWWET